ncbi:MAG: CAP domain-containing protein [Agriterribacter sp.]
MKRFTLIFIVLISFVSSYSQGSITFSDKPFVMETEKDTALQHFLVSNGAYTSLNKDEQEVVYWINYVRLKPQEFASTILTPFLQQFPETKSSYTKSLLSELKNMAPVQVLTPFEKLNQTSLGHAKDLGSKGLDISHSSSSGLSFQQRMNAAGFVQCVSENIYEGRLSPLESVIFLLIDHGVKNLGHRRNMLDSKVKKIGVGFYAIKGKPEMYFLVQDFACE